MPKMLKDSDGEFDLMLMINHEPNPGDFRVKLYPVKRYVNGRVRGFSDYDPTQLYLDNLYASAFGYESSDGSRQATGWTVEYHEVYRIDTRRANRMSKTLDAIAKKTEKMREKLGPPTTFGQFCARFGLAIGASGMLERADTNGSSSYDDHKYNAMTLGAGSSTIDHLCNKWVAEGTKEERVHG